MEDLKYLATTVTNQTIVLSFLLCGFETWFQGFGMWFLARKKMNEQGTILDEITRKQIIWYGHVERMDPTRLPKIMVNWKPEGRKKRCRPPKEPERWDIYSHE